MKKLTRSLIPLVLILFISGLALSAADEMVKCAVCGKEMKKAEAKITYEYKGQTYYFASEKCKEAFVKEPEKFLKTIYTCPMHPDVKSDKPGKCPKCGMNLEKKTGPDGKKMAGCAMGKEGGCCGKGKETGTPVKKDQK